VESTDAYWGPASYLKNREEDSASSAEALGSEPNSSAAFSHCLAMNRSEFRYYEPQEECKLRLTELPAISLES
jgi:hypothetical protein